MKQRLQRLKTTTINTAIVLFHAEVMSLVNYFECNCLRRTSRRGNRWQTLFPFHIGSVKARQGAGLPRTNIKLAQCASGINGNSLCFHFTIRRSLKTGESRTTRKPEPSSYKAETWLSQLKDTWQSTHEPRLYRKIRFSSSFETLLTI